MWHLVADPSPLPFSALSALLCVAENINAASGWPRPLARGAHVPQGHGFTVALSSSLVEFMRKALEYESEITFFLPIFKQLDKPLLT